MTKWKRHNHFATKKQRRKQTCLFRPQKRQLWCWNYLTYSISLIAIPQWLCFRWVFSCSYSFFLFSFFSSLFTSEMLLRLGSCQVVNLASRSRGQWCHHIQMYPHLYSSRVERRSWGPGPFLRWKGQAGFVTVLGSGLPSRASFCFSLHSWHTAASLSGVFFGGESTSLRWTSNSHLPSTDSAQLSKAGTHFNSLTWRENSEYRFRISGAYYKRGQKRIHSVFHREIENNHIHTHSS